MGFHDGSSGARKRERIAAAGGRTTNTDPIDLKQLVDALRGPSPEYKRDAIDTIVVHREETTPQLLALLDEILDDPEAYVAGMDPEGFDAIYALVILAHLREADAHERIVRRACLPDAVREALLGELYLEELEVMLVATCAGRTDLIRALVTNDAVNEYVRSHAAKALVMSVHFRYAEREEVLALLASQLVPEAAPVGSYLWSGVIASIRGRRVT